jgi:hypothetical protein
MVILLATTNHFLVDRLNYMQQHHLEMDAIKSAHAARGRCSFVKMVKLMMKLFAIMVVHVLHLLSTASHVLKNMCALLLPSIVINPQGQK